MFLLGTSVVTLSDIRWDFIIGGFGLFLFGIKYMGDGLKSFAGEKLREYIEKYTSTPWKGIIVGAMITCFIQSSSATTAITIGLVRVGLMNLKQAVGIIMGANIGTTITAFLIGMKVEALALYFVFVGACVITFSHRKKMLYLGEILLGFGLLFFGLKLMGEELQLFKFLPGFNELAIQFGQNPVIALITGTIMTAIVQSSSAVIGIVQKIYETGGFTLAAALPFLFGSNIGTTITAIFAAIGGTTAAKRAAGIHVMFNVIGSVLFLFLLQPLESIILYLANAYHIAPMLQIAVAHIIFNITITLLFYPFITPLVTFIKKVIKGEDREDLQVNMDELNVDIAMRLPASGLNLAKQSTLKMGRICLDMVDETKEYFLTQNKMHKDTIEQMEGITNTFDKKITGYLLIISQEQLGDHDAKHSMLMMEIVKNLERIGDLCTNVVEFFEMIFDAKETLTPIAMEDVTKMFDMLHDMTQLSLQYYDEPNDALAQQVMDMEDRLDAMEDFARIGHIERMMAKECVNAVAGSVYVDILSNMERLGDHACNIVRKTKAVL